MCNLAREVFLGHPILLTSRVLGFTVDPCFKQRDRKKLSLKIKVVGLAPCRNSYCLCLSHVRLILLVP